MPLANTVPAEGKWGQGVATRKVDYSHDLMMADAYRFVRENREGPFFLYLALTIPHANNEARDKGMEVPDYGPYADRDWPEPQKGHAAMITRMDRDLGRLFDLLSQLGIDDNTIVLFTSDNGPHAEGGNDPDFQDSNGPLRGTKRSLHEGGIRVPLIARWPGHVPAGTTSDWIGGFADVMPTLAELAGTSQELPRSIDGVSFVPTLLSEGTQPSRDFLYWAFYERGGARAIRQGDWKAVQQPIHTAIRLYRLDEDLGEEHDLAARFPHRVAELTRLMDDAYTPSARWHFPDAQRKGPKR